MLYIFANVDCTHVCTPYFPLQNITTYQILLLLSTLPIYRASHSLLRGLGNIAQENTTADILIEGIAEQSMSPSLWYELSTEAVP